LDSVKRALVSVSDKTGIVELAKGLTELKIEIVSTGGTAQLIKENGIDVKEVEEVTDFPEILGGRVKTLHPAIHGGLLADRSKKEHMNEIEELDITPVDMVVGNLYPFKQAVAGGADRKEAVENIDIGGPTMLRAAAKNHDHVVVIVDPDDYPRILNELKNNDNKVEFDFRIKLAEKVFRHTASYDKSIAEFFSNFTEG